MNDKDKKVDNLINLVENYTRTQRHLEQYSDIGNPDNVDNARNKQNIREEQIDILKDQITDKENNNPDNSGEMSNLLENYVSSQGYMENNLDHMSQEMLDNLEKKQKNREIQINDLTQN